MKNKVLILFVLVIFLGCKEDEPDLTTDSNSAVLEEIIDLAEANSINRLTIDWGDTRERANNALNEEGFEQAIRTLLRILGDNHSSYRSSDVTYYESTFFCNASDLSIGDIPENIGYVAVSGFNGSGDEGVAFAQAIQQELQTGIDHAANSWIVDLTNNTGGNMYPMIAGIGPLLGNNVLGFFIDPLGQESIWGYDGGVSYINSRTNNPITTVPDALENFAPETKVAVIIDNLTISSGEATAISFIGRPNTRFFGEASCGLSTANRAYSLSNGDLFVLTTSVMADRNKNPYGGAIEPDETFDNAEDLTARVIEWLQEE